MALILRLDQSDSIVLMENGGYTRGDWNLFSVFSKDVCSERDKIGLLWSLSSIKMISSLGMVTKFKCILNNIRYPKIFLVKRNPSMTISKPLVNFLDPHQHCFFVGTMDMTVTFIDDYSPCQPLVASSLFSGQMEIWVFPGLKFKSLDIFCKCWIIWYLFKQPRHLEVFTFPF